MKSTQPDCILIKKKSAVGKLHLRTTKSVNKNNLDGEKMKKREKKIQVEASLLPSVLED